MRTLTTRQDAIHASRSGNSAPVFPPPTPPPRPPVGFHGAVGEFKRRLIEATLAQSGGNRTRAAKALGLQRTYLLRLMREFQIRIPPSAIRPGRDSAALGPGPPSPRLGERRL